MISSECVFSTKVHEITVQDPNVDGGELLLQLILEQLIVETLNGIKWVLLI
jgi:hypothetical protein